MTAPVCIGRHCNSGSIGLADVTIRREPPIHHFALVDSAFCDALRSLRVFLRVLDDLERSLRNLLQPLRNLPCSFDSAEPPVSVLNALQRKCLQRLRVLRGSR
jgi:hypothetical protein